MRYDLVVEPKAGKFGAFAVFFFGVLYILVAFGALYMWFDADFALAAAVAIAAITVPMIVGFAITELVHQRAGALAFVLTAAALTGALGAWAIAENDDFQDRMDLISPGRTVGADS